MGRALYGQMESIRKHWPTSRYSSSEPCRVSIAFRPTSNRSSACSVLSPSLLTCLHHFVQARRWPNVANAAVLQGRMLRHELHSMIHVPRFKDENAAELFLSFRIGAVRSCDFAVLPIQIGRAH